MPPALPPFPTRRSSDLRVAPLSRGRLSQRPDGCRGRGSWDPVRPHLCDPTGHGKAGPAFPAAARPGKAGPALPCPVGSQRCGRSEEHTSELQSHSDLVCPQLYPLSLHDALPISALHRFRGVVCPSARTAAAVEDHGIPSDRIFVIPPGTAKPDRPFRPRRGPVRPVRLCRARWDHKDAVDRKSTRLNSSHTVISYAPSSTPFPYTTLFRSPRCTAFAGSFVPAPGRLPRSRIMGSRPTASL